MFAISVSAAATVLLFLGCAWTMAEPTAPVGQPDKRLRGRVANDDWMRMPPPVVEGPFVRPADAALAQPVWGHAGGLRVGLYPMRGPRGLLRIYDPDVGLPPGRVINFIAIEPIREGQHHRALSELEPSALDGGAPGKRFWAANDPADRTPRLAEERPARGIVTREGDVALLRVYIQLERNDNGTRPYLRLTFRQDRPREVGIALFAHADSAPMATCIATATMGNFSRLRQLHLAGGRVVHARELWPDHRDSSFAVHRQFRLDQLPRDAAGGVIVAATSDEADPASVTEGFPHPGWRYVGKKVTQYWRCEDPDPDLRLLVNGRFTYYATEGPIPNGISYENFELAAPFRAGQEFWFGVTARSPAQLGIAPAARSAAATAKAITDP